MKRAWLFLALISVAAAPALCRAGSLPANYHAQKVDESELAQNTGQGCQLLVNLPNQKEHIVIWDEWARNSANAGGSGNTANLGVGAVNYGTRQATFTATK
jgi:hypothetical protein